MDTKKPKIFLSYTREDMGMARKLYNDLKRYGLDIWFDKESILGGQNWKVEVKKAIQKSNYFLVILSKNSVSHEGYVQKEIRIALEKQELRSESKIFIIPIRIEECEPDYEKLFDLSWIDLFPENEYQNGLKKILRVVSPETFLLRSKPMELSESDVHEIIKNHNFFDTSKNLIGKGFPHHYTELKKNGDRIIFDEFSSLIWQQSGSDKQISFDYSKTWIKKLNKKGFAGFNDWRLPTFEEAMSLMEPEKEINGLYINPIFDRKKDWIWTSDKVKGASSAWFISFYYGFCGWSDANFKLSYVRAVRSEQSNKKD